MSESSPGFHDILSSEIPPPLVPQPVPIQIRRATSPLPITLTGIVARNLPNQSGLLKQSHSALGFARPAPRNAQSQFIFLDAFQITPEVIAGFDQVYTMGADISGVAYAGTEFTLERTLSEERQNSRASEADSLGCNVATWRGL
ncbi:hypothetical protein EI94DRAFT_1819439 [Lactarius quietus]|nr:hypothetical protein EI94DRAFT_1819439 [Lactarius quietus]